MEWVVLAQAVVPPAAGLSGVELAAIITAVGGFVAALIGGFKALRPDKVKDFQGVVDGYVKIVRDLRTEVDRANSKNDELEERILHLEELVSNGDPARVKKLERENTQLRRRVKELEDEVHDLRKLVEESNGTS